MRRDLDLSVGSSNGLNEAERPLEKERIVAMKNKFRFASLTQNLHERTRKLIHPSEALTDLDNSQCPIGSLSKFSVAGLVHRHTCKDL